MAARSASLAAREVSSMTATRKVVWPTSGITLTAAGVPRSASIQARNVPKRNSSAGPSRSSGCGMLSR
ncbi:hypothetical protein D3C73_1356130 [compost metagenome]